jgi:hypothetical protein
MEAFVDISRWWTKDEGGKLASVNSVFEKFKGTSNEVTRHTLTRALEGKLKKGDFDNLVKLSRICSELSGENLTIVDLIVIKEDEAQ